MQPYAPYMVIYSDPEWRIPREPNPPLSKLQSSLPEPLQNAPYFSQFQPGRPEPSLNIYPSILSDFEANPWFCLLFAVSIQLPRTPPECVILPAFLQFYLFLKPTKAFAYFPTFRLGSWRPECFSRSVLFMLFPNLSSHFVVFLFFPAVS